MNNTYLYHHGIKGQKWGVRRYQNPDGTLTDAGRKRKENQKDDKSIVKKIVIGVGVTAGIAAGAYFAKRYYDMNADNVIRSGKVFQHMGRSNEDLSKPFYASYLKGDNKIYAKNDFWGSNWKTQKELICKRDIKIAGRKVTEKTFEDWIRTSSIAKERFSDVDISSKAKLRKAYYKFNKNLNSPDMRDKEIFNDFYSALMSKGYDAIRDVNDQKNSGVRSPIIIFGSLSDIMTMKVTELK